MNSDPMHKTILAFGELLWDLLPSGAVLGGAPANFAFRMHSLGDRCILVSRLGRDTLGQAAISRLTELRMETQCIQWDTAYPTGTVQVSLSPTGNPDFQIVRDAAYDHIESVPQLLNFAAQAHCLCFGTLAQRASATRQTLQDLLQAAPQALKLLDLNLRKDCYSAETIVYSLQQADILKLNEQEAFYLASLFQIPPAPLDHFGAAAIQKWGLSHCLITLGERGAFAITAKGDRAYSPGYTVALRDTCGSGDACTAGFLHALLQGKPLAECVHLGNALGAIVATQDGATEPIAPGQLNEFESGSHERVIEPSLVAWITATDG